MDIYPATSRLLEMVPEPLLAGVLGGVGFMCLALVLLLGSACVISYKRDQRRINKTREPLPAIYKCSPSIKTPGTGSPDSVLKKSLLPASILYPTTSSTSTSSSSFSHTDSYSNDNHQQRNQLSSNYSRGRLTRTTSFPISPPIELISRGPDGRFALPLYDNDTLSKKSVSYSHPARVRRSVSLHSEREDKKGPPFVLSVDLPPFKPSNADSTSPIFGMGQRSPASCYGPHVVDQNSSDHGLLNLNSMCSNSSLATTVPPLVPTFPVLPHIKSSLGQQSTTASALVLQMELERERGNLSHCLKLAQEREELERELQRYTLGRSFGRELCREHVDLERRELEAAYDVMWEYKSSTLPHRKPQVTNGSFALSQSPFSVPSEQWETRPLVSPPAQSRFNASTPAGAASCFNHYATPSFTKQAPFQHEEEGSFSQNRLTLPHASAKHHRYEREEAAPEGYENSPQSTLSEMQMNDSSSETARQNNLSRGSLSTLSFHSNKQSQISHFALEAVPDFSKEEGASPRSADNEDVVFVEMSVDEPEMEVHVMHPTKPMLHQRIASHVQRGQPLARTGRYEDMSRSMSLTGSPSSVDEMVRVRATLQTPNPEPWKAHGSRTWDSKRRSQSLDSKRRRERRFLTPNAWIDSLSQENCSVDSSRHPDSLFWEPKSCPTRKISKVPDNLPSATEAAPHSHTNVDPLSSKTSPEGPKPNPDMPCHYESRREASIFKWPNSYQEAMKKAQCSLEAMPEASRCLPPNNNDPEELEVEAGDYEGVPGSGSSYNSYASSGRGSMEPANGRLSLCHLSPTLACSPETVEENHGCIEEKQNHQMEPSQRRKASVDENYEWDAADCCSQTGDHEGLPSSTDLPKPAQCRGLPSMHCSTTKALKHCTQLPLLQGHQSSHSAEPEPDTVLF